MIKSRLWISAAIPFGLSLLVYAAGCNNKPAAPPTEPAANQTPNKQSNAEKARKTSVLSTDLDKVEQAFKSGDATAVQQFMDKLMEAYAGQTEFKRRAGQILADNALSNPDPQLRVAALSAMSPDPVDARDVALEATKDKYPQVVAAACELISKISGDPASKQRLEDLSKSSDQTIAAAATQGLAAWYRAGGGESMIALAKLLGDTRGDASAQAAMSLHQSGAKAVPVLIGTLRSSTNARARAAAAITLACVCAGANPTQQKFAAAAHAFVKSQSQVQRANLAGLQPMIDGLRKDPEPMVREACAQGLGYLGDEQAAAPLAAALKDPDANVRRRAASALVTIPAKSVQPQLEAALASDRSADVRRNAAEAIYWIGDRSAVTPLMRATRDRSAEVRRYAAESLGRLGARLGDKQATDALISLFNDKDEDVRWAAVAAEGTLADPRAEQALVAATHDPSEMVATAADQALRKIGVASSRGWHMRGQQ